MIWLPLGDAALRTELPEGAPPRAVLEALRACEGVEDVILGARHVAVTFAPGRPPEGLDAALDAATAREPAARPRAHRVLVRYDGADLEAVAARTGLAPAEVIARHAAPTYVVSRIGFLPGFAYLDGLDPSLALPRLSSPRPRVPALAVGIAGTRTGIYPFASPGGWHLLGTAVGFCPFDPARGAALALGDEVRFEAVP